MSLQKMFFVRFTDLFFIFFIFSLSCTLVITNSHYYRVVIWHPRFDVITCKLSYSWIHFGGQLTTFDGCNGSNRATEQYSMLSPTILQATASRTAAGRIKSITNKLSKNYTDSLATGFCRFPKTIHIFSLIAQTILFSSFLLPKLTCNLHLNPLSSPNLQGLLLVIISCS